VREELEDDAKLPYVFFCSELVRITPVPDAEMLEGSRRGGTNMRSSIYLALRVETNGSVA
jgi:hypothetical protein